MSIEDCSNADVLAEIEEAKSARWGAKLNTCGFPTYPCPECGEMQFPTEAWVNQKGKQVCNIECRDCKASSCTFCWNLWQESPLFEENRFYLEAFSEDACEEVDNETQMMNCTLSLEGFRTSMEFATRAENWFNRGHPLTYRMPVSCMKNGKVADTEMIPLSIPNRVMWRSMTLEVHHLDKNDNKATVCLAVDVEKRNGGSHSLMMDDVTKVEIIDGKFVIADGDCTATVEIIDVPEVKAKHAPKWFLDEMTSPIGSTGNASADYILRRSDNIEWLHPMGEASCVQTIKTHRQSSLEDFA